jgi:hypothetical protein
MDQQKLSASAFAEHLQRIEQIVSDDEEDTRLLHEMATRAHRYLESFQWCVSIVDGWFARGVGGIFALFLFRIVPADADVDEWLWVMNGDLPSIYLSFQDAPLVEEAFSEYVAGMARWVTYVRSGEIIEPENLPPVDIPETIQVADDLKRRIDSLERILGPLFS